jgi:RNA polymerase sigma factor FliA
MDKREALGMYPELTPRMLELIETHRGYSRALAAEVLRGLPQQVLREDVEAAAELGLVEAAQAFDSSRGVLFKTFAYYRIRGAIYDALRKMTWFSKSLYDKYKFEMAANEYLGDYASGTLQTDSTNPAQAAASVVDTIASCYLLSIDAEGIDQADHKSPSPEESVIEADTFAHLHVALEQLPEKNRRVLRGYYFDNLSLEEIGEQLGLSKSWVCRVHARSLELLREAMEQIGALPVAMGEATFRAALR